ncbi:prolyl oligopeptidase family serine peptidase [Microbacterium sp. 1.5R]|uniref:S9 family peptidase n=1 Tax=Microbacterium sp. 1.5R TaxID=1916917 RepID=UPI001642A377|nr:prolyl oligopeptidase family serine peptidase [Microbacterium sp. 1.5R]
MTASDSETTDWSDRYAAVQHLFDVDALVQNASVYPRWIEGASAFWYERQTDEGVEYRVVDATTGDNRLVVTHRTLIDAMGEHLGEALSAADVILRDLEVRLDPADTVEFAWAGRSWAFGHASGLTARDGHVARGDLSVSPDGRLAISVRDHDLWMHDLTDGSERRVTADGAEDNAYGMGVGSMRQVYAKYGLRTAPDGLWSKDSRHFFTLQTDERLVADLPAMTFVPADGQRPIAHRNKTSAPGDEHIARFRMFVLDAVEGAQLVPERAPIAATRMGDTPFAAELAWWSADGRTAYFVDVERGECAAEVVAFEISTGHTSTVFREQAAEPLELSVSVYDPALVIPLPDTDELIWFSERTGRGHLYLYDLVTGCEVRALTSGEWQVRELLRVDPVRREVAFLAGGVDPHDNPYLRSVAVSGLDDGVVRIVSGGGGDHRVWRPQSWDIAVLSRTRGADIGRISGYAPAGEYFVETVGAVDALPRSVLRRRDGSEVCVVEQARAIGFPDGWRWPRSVQVTASDGVTELWGLLFEPVAVDAGERHPLIDLVYGAPQESLVPTSAFVDHPTTTTYVEAAGYAALGAYCLLLDGRGTANRERSFRLASYRATETASDLDDHVAAIRQLAETHPIDLGRLGITGFSGGGTLAARAALQRSDVFSVAVAASGNYDLRLFGHAYGERYQGLFDAEAYERQAVKTHAAQASGKLLLIHGLMDFGVHPAGLFQLVQALIDENKDVDLVVLPTTGHEVTGYGTRRRLDYFVTHLFGGTPPPPVRMQDLRGIVMQREQTDAAIVAYLDPEE